MHTLKRSAWDGTALLWRCNVALTLFAISMVVFIVFESCLDASDRDTVCSFKRLPTLSRMVTFDGSMVVSQGFVCVVTLYAVLRLELSVIAAIWHITFVRSSNASLLYTQLGAEA